MRAANELNVLYCALLGGSCAFLDAVLDGLVDVLKLLITKGFAKI